VLQDGRAGDDGAAMVTFSFSLFFFFSSCYRRVEAPFVNKKSRGAVELLQFLFLLLFSRTESAYFIASAWLTRPDHAGRSRIEFDDDYRQIRFRLGFFLSLFFSFFSFF